MMKNIWIPTAILLAMVGAILLNTLYLKDFIIPLQENLSLAQSYASEENWEKAKELSKASYETWTEKNLYLHITLKHEEIDQIHILMEEVLAYLTQEKIGEYHATNSILIARLTLLYEMEELSLKNLF